MNKRLLSTAVLLLSTILVFAQSGIEIPARLTDRPELIIKHTGYTVSYNTARGTPNWSAWMLTKSHLSGQEPRSPQFFADPSVPSAYRIRPEDYTNSGYDRGHMCPAADMAWSTQAMRDCFYMSNMCPQVPALNRVSWKALESACRKWTVSEDTIYIVCGPVYNRGSHRRIGHSHIVDVPDGFFKVTLSLRKGHAKAIGFYYVNDATKQSMSATATTVDYIESLTGIDFYSTLPDDLENKLESHCNISDWK